MLEIRNLQQITSVMEGETMWKRDAIYRLEKSETNKRAAAVRADRRERDRLQRRRVLR
jgi:hypothetical protein